MTKEKKIEFIANFAPVANAVQFHQEGGARIHLDISDEYLGAALLLAGGWLSRRMKITIEESP